jgi:PAS domain S-box-containing protein
VLQAHSEAGAGDGGWEDLFWTVFGLSTNPIALHDRQRVMLEPNAAMWELLGGSRDEIVGRKIDDFLPLEERATSASDWRQLWEVGNYTGDRHVVRLDDAPVFVQYAGRICKVSGRRFAVIVLLETQLEDQLIASRARGALTAREREVLHLIALGYSGPQIAEKLVISYDTVRTHARNAMAKTGARTRAQLVAMALADRHIDPGTRRSP